MTAAPGSRLGDAHVPLRDQVTDRIRTEIAAGTLLPGERLVERDLAERLGVSRVPVREALRRLESEGFVVVLPRRGAVVRELSPQDVDDLFDVREALEVQAFRLAARRGSGSEKEALRDNAARAAAALHAGDDTEAYRLNALFHDVAVSAAHNGLLEELLAPLHGRMSWLLRQNGDPARVVEEHRSLAEAVTAGDETAAAQAAAAHVATSRMLAAEVLGADQAKRVARASVS